MGVRWLNAVVTGGISEAVRAVQGGNKNQGGGAAQAPAAPSVNDEPTISETPEEKRKRLVRAALISTTPQGDLSPVTTGRQKLLGN